MTVRRPNNHRRPPGRPPRRSTPRPTGAKGRGQPGSAARKPGGPAGRRSGGGAKPNRGGGRRRILAPSRVPASLAEASPPTTQLAGLFAQRQAAEHAAAAERIRFQMDAAAVEARARRQLNSISGRIGRFILGR